MGLDNFKVKQGLSIEGTLIKRYAGSPEGNVTAPVGSICMDITNGDLYKKKTGTGNTGWQEMAESGEASTEDGYQNTFMGKSGTGSETPTYTSVDVVTQNDNLEVAIGKLDAEIGAAVATPQSRTVGAISDQEVNNNIEALDDAIGNDVTPISRTNNPTSASNDINDNIDTLDDAIGDDVVPNSRTNNPISTGNDVNGNIEALDDAIGLDSEITNENYISKSDTVSKNLNDLDGQVKTNEDAISGIVGGLSWRMKCICVTDDDDLQNANIGDTLSTLLPFSDDEGSQLAIGDFSDGDYILSRNTSPESGENNDTLWKIYDDSGTLKITTSGFDALAEADTFYVKYDLIDSPAAQETAAIWTYNGTDLVKTGDVDWELATGIDLSSGYAAAGGNVVGGDTIEAAIGKLDDNQDDINTTLGVAQGATDLGNLSGASEEILGDNESVKDALIDLADEIGVAVTNSEVISDQAINLNLDDLDGRFTESHKKINSVSIGTSTTVDIDVISKTNLVAVIWEIVIIDGTTSGNRYESTVKCLTDGTNVDFNEFGILELHDSGDYVSDNITISVAIDGTNIDLRATNADGTISYTAHVVRKSVKSV